jgi:hypothetical protein
MAASTHRQEAPGHPALTTSQQWAAIGRQPGRSVGGGGSSVHYHYVCVCHIRPRTRAPMYHNFILRGLLTCFSR